MNVQTTTGKVRYYATLCFLVSASVLVRSYFPTHWGYWASGVVMGFALAVIAVSRS